MTTAAPPRPPKERPEIDPRLRARRIEVRRDEGRRRLRRLSVLGAVALVLAALWALSLTPLVDVDHIRVRGAAHTGADAIVEALDIRRGDALLTADVGGAASAVSKLPWVATAKVRRSWPGTIVVTVVEHEAVAVIEARGGGWVAVDAGGTQLATMEEPPLELVRVAGLALAADPGEPAGARYQGALDVAAVLPPSLKPAVLALWPQRDGSIEATVRLRDGGQATARLGPPDQLEAKLLALATVLEHADPAGLRVIDVRVPAGPALTRG